MKTFERNAQRFETVCFSMFNTFFCFFSLLYNTFIYIMWVCEWTKLILKHVIIIFAEYT